MNIPGCHPDDLRYCPISPWWHNVIWTLCHTDKLAPGRISSGWLKCAAVCHPDEITNWILKSSRWLNYCQYLIRMTFNYCPYLIRMTKFLVVSHPDELTDGISHPDDLWTLQYVIRMTYRTTTCHNDDCNWFFIRISYDNVMSSGRHTPPVLRHPNKVAKFHFSQQAVALQRFCTNWVVTIYTMVITVTGWYFVR